MGHKECIGRRMLRLKPPDMRQRGRPKLRFMNKEDVKLVGLRIEDVENSQTVKYFYLGQNGINFHHFFFFKVNIFQTHGFCLKETTC